MKILHLLAVTLATLTAALALANPAAAENGCADGHTPAAPGSGSSGCVPIPGLYQVPGGTQGESAAPSVRWEDRWGAIAVDSVTGKTGVAGSKATRQKAEAALAICAQKGGGDCKVNLSYANQCGVIAGATTGHPPGSRPRWKKHRLALNECAQVSGGTCEVFFRLQHAGAHAIAGKPAALACRGAVRHC